MNNPGSSVYYFNNFRMWLNNDFYFDYTSTDNCFLYYRIPGMKCLKAKEGYARYSSIAIKSDKCSSYST